MNALVHAIEINDRHGVGIFLRRLFGNGDDFILFRSRTLYAGENAFGLHEEFLGDRFANAGELRERLRNVVRHMPIERILCVPYYPEDFRHALLLKEVSGAPLCTYLMDDQNIFTREVGDAAVGALLRASDLRLGISPQMCLAYERKFGCSVAWLPPVVEKQRSFSAGPEVAGRAAMIGNVWSARQLDDLRQITRETKWTIDWFGRGPEASWLSVTREDLERDGLQPCGFLADDVLPERLAQYPFAIVPSGRMDDGDDKRSFSSLSLPSRIVFLLTQAGVPLLVLGSERSAAAAFVLETGCGSVADYNADSFQRAAGRLMEDQAAFREAATRAAEWLVQPDAGEWIWKSLERGVPADDRFERQRTGRLAKLEIEVGREVIRPPIVRRGFFGRRFGRLEDPRWLRFSRRSHLRAIRREVALAAGGPHTFEVSEYQRALVAALVRKGVATGSRVGLLGGDPGILRPLRGKFDVVRIDPSHPAEKVAALVSFNCEVQMTRHELEALTLPNALHVHCWTAYARPGHFWAPPPAMALLDELDDLSLVADDLISDPDFLFMSPKAVETFWKPSDRSAAEAAGRPFSLNLCWRSPK